MSTGEITRKMTRPSQPLIGDLAVQSLGGLDALEGRDVRPDGRHHDERSGEERERRLRRVVPELLGPPRPAVVGHLAVDEVPPEDLVDPERDEAEDDDQDRVANLRDCARRQLNVIRRQRSSQDGRLIGRDGHGGSLRLRSASTTVSAPRRPSVGAGRVARLRLGQTQRPYHSKGHENQPGFRRPIGVGSTY